jgi:DNA-binding FadR family transcriptional regulator
MKNKRLFWHIVEKIEKMIDSGKYSVGSRLPSERLLAETFNVSRPTVREAIIALEVRERVEVKTSSGVYVLANKYKREDFVKASAFELTQARALLEGEAAALAASKITPEELAELKTTLENMATGDDPEAADKSFHLIISTATRNKALLQAMKNLWKIRDENITIQHAYEDVCKQSDEKRLVEHTKIYEALKNGDADAARYAMHQHFNRLINALFEVSEAQALEEVRRRTTETRGLYSLNHLIK